VCVCVCKFLPTYKSAKIITLESQCIITVTVCLVHCDIEELDSDGDEDETVINDVFIVVVHCDGHAPFWQLGARQRRGPARSSLGIGYDCFRPGCTKYREMHE